ncbi:DUF917 domain-containing protein [Parvularcula sp. ZS-1/3]|uniref:DUF917 domain-containing protein n=1 Tax=Parvularcula mediterranea TaxID=2732508 RepID=A0A7Y3RLF3_9PROT|nr:DUF917 domain-containing protein [Parvularcula mediterranea]NNU15507.1 DUF917 domain-containing protein [Parvularcula mediterranea]
MLGRRQFVTGLALGLGAVAGCSEGSEAEAPAPASAPAGTPPKGQALSLTDLEDALTGASYLGCGGGGGLAEARKLIRDDIAAGRSFSMLPVERLRDKDRVACPYGLASLAPTSPEMKARLDSFENLDTFPVLSSFEHLEQHLGTRFAGVILGEIGPLSLAEGLSIAARIGRPALDADTVGRAVPEINQHSVKVAGLPLTPIGGATPFRDRVVLSETGHPTRAEDMLRGLAVVSRELGVTDSPITGAEAKRTGTLVTGSLSLAMGIGAAVRQALAAGGDAIEAARLAGDGYTLFQGEVQDFNWRDEDGFLMGTLTVTGTGAFAGSTLLTDYKNEHLLARRDGEVIATCPDLITVIDEETADGINNPDFVRGQKVRVLGFRCDPLWRTPQGLEVFSPGYFGYDADYIPIEERLG